MLVFLDFALWLCLLNSRIFYTISTISLYISISFSSLLISSISSLKSMNPLRIKFTWILFFSGLFLIFFNFFSNATKFWNKKCFLTNSLFMSHSFRKTSLSNFLQLIRPFSSLISFSLYSNLLSSLVLNLLNWKYFIFKNNQ